MDVLPWIKDDVAIEIIGKMIAEKMSAFHEYAAALLEAGCEIDELDVEGKSGYQEFLNEIRTFKAEINQIYRGENLPPLYRKIETDYVPHLQGISKYTVAST